MVRSKGGNLLEGVCSQSRLQASPRQDPVDKFRVQARREIVHVSKKQWARLVVGGDF